MEVSAWKMKYLLLKNKLKKLKFNGKKANEILLIAILNYT